MNGDPNEAGTRLAEILAAIARAETAAMFHDRARDDRDAHATAAHHADECAEAGRRTARLLIENAFPGVRWAMIERAGL